MVTGHGGGRGDVCVSFQVYSFGSHYSYLYRLRITVIVKMSLKIKLGKG